MEHYVQQTRTGSKFGEDSGNVSEAEKKELEIHLDGKKLKQRDSFVYLGGAICGVGKSDTEIHRRIAAGANAWRKVEEVMGDRRISRKLK